jgi:hypothetical protein
VAAIASVAASVKNFQFPLFIVLILLLDVTYTEQAFGGPPSFHCAEVRKPLKVLNTLCLLLPPSNHVVKPELTEPFIEAQGAIGP